MPADAFDLGASLDLVRQLIDERRQGPVTRWQPPEELLAGLDLDIGAQGCDVRRLLDAVNLVLGFLLFRLLDVVKPFPARLVEVKLPGGWGIVLDDVVAGVYSNLCLRIIRVYIDF